MSASDLHTAHSRLFVRALASAGVRHAIVSPGSRSTPLALAFAHERELSTSVIVDERSAGFAALGQARVTGLPSVLIATSGSAGAHYFPAILEAERARVPVIAITADRPWELTDACASQTLDQTKLFGSHVRAAFELGLPDRAALEHVPRIAAHAVLAALSPNAGPVHVNARFRKPLEPIDAEVEPWRAAYDRLFARGAPRVFAPELRPAAAAVEHLCELVQTTKRGALVAGPAHASDSDRLAASVARLVKRSGFALYAETTSGLCFHPETASLVVASPELGVRAGAFDADFVIEIGHPPASRAYAELAKAVRRAVIAPDGVPDPIGSAESVVLGDPAATLDLLADSFSPRARTPERLSARIDDGALTEPRIARSLSVTLPPRAFLICGNSLPVRDFDAFAVPAPSSVRVLHQRGLAGIDGLVAGAFGVRDVVPADASVALLLGDVAALHDLGSLALLADAKGPLAVVIVDNQGGRIFGELPIARSGLGADFERLFLTPPSVALERAIAGFGVQTRAARTTDQLEKSLHEAFDSDRPTAIVARVDPMASARHRAELFESVRRKTQRTMESQHDHA